MSRPHKISLTRRYEFPAAHTLCSEEFSREENVRIYGKCANPAGHGHNYAIEVTISSIAGAEVDGYGVAFPRGTLDTIMQEEIASKFAYRDLNESFDFVTTGENLAIAVWNLLDKRIGGGRRLSVCVIETNKNAFEYSGV